uniref:Uncharacterized protein n=1 Tax=Anguilla anguilla TaxID=7936 RepID=A0A0E9RC85_ANGAN
MKNLTVLAVNHFVDKIMNHYRLSMSKHLVCVAYSEDSLRLKVHHCSIETSAVCLTELKFFLGNVMS